MEITAIDSSAGATGWLAGATRIGEIYFTDVASFITNVLATAGTGSIDRLNILSHGNSSGFYMGSDYVDSTSYPTFSASFRRLSGHFAAAGFIHIQACEIGMNQPLLLTIAGDTGVNVYAGTSFHNPVYRFNFGNYVLCRPSGTTCPVSGRP